MIMRAPVLRCALRSPLLVENQVAATDPPSTHGTDAPPPPQWPLYWVAVADVTQLWIQSRISLNSGEANAMLLPAAQIL